MIKFSLILLGGAGVFYLFFCGLLYVQQRSMMYYPTPATDSARADAVWIENEGLRIKLWRVNGQQARSIIYFGGNAEDVSRSADAFARLFPDYTIYFVNYRGYGGSGGRPTEAGLKSDALAVYDHVRESSDDISIISRSIGTGIALHLAAARNIRKLVLLTPFDSAVSVAKAAFPIFPVGLLLKDRYESAPYVDRLDMPLLVVLAERDGIIPQANSRAFVEAVSGSNVVVKTISGATHNTLDGSPEFVHALREFM